MLASNHAPSPHTPVKVSVLLFTYNHEKWIAQAIDSTLTQKTDFEYEVVILEDCSTDATRDIVLDFQSRYPDRIRLILSEKNKNDNTSLVTAWKGSPSQYVALLDGDDYWTSPHKLQVQVDFLDAYPECAMCFHNVMILYEDGSYKPWNPTRFELKETSTLRDLWVGCFIHSSSAMLRKGLVGEFPSWYTSEMWADWALFILMAQHGKIGYLDELMSAYRVHSGGLWSGLSEAQQSEQTIEFYKRMNRNLDFKHKRLIEPMISRYRRELAFQSNRQQRIRSVARRILPVGVRRWIRGLWLRQP